MKLIVDTNVAVVANRRSPQASLACIFACVQALGDLTRSGVLVLDDNWHILKEYLHNLESSGQPGVGDAFCKWALTNWKNPRYCELVRISPIEKPTDHCRFHEFPADPALSAFDPSDQKFVAVARTHPERPPILNATDSDWWEQRVALAQHNIHVQHLCPDATPRPA